MREISQEEYDAIMGQVDIECFMGGIEATDKPYLGRVIEADGRLFLFSPGEKITPEVQSLVDKDFKVFLDSNLSQKV